VVSFVLLKYDFSSTGFYQVTQFAMETLELGRLVLG